MEPYSTSMPYVNYLFFYITSCCGCNLFLLCSETPAYVTSHA